MADQPICYRGCHFPGVVIAHAVWLYLRFPLRATAMWRNGLPSVASRSATRQSGAGWLGLVRSTPRSCASGMHVREGRGTWMRWQSKSGTSGTGSGGVGRSPEDRAGCGDLRPLRQQGFPGERVGIRGGGAAGGAPGGDAGAAGAGAGGAAGLQPPLPGAAAQHLQAALQPAVRFHPSSPGVEHATRPPCVTAVVGQRFQLIAGMLALCLNGPAASNAHPFGILSTWLKLYTETPVAVRSCARFSCFSTSVQPLIAPTPT